MKVIFDKEIVELQKKRIELIKEQAKVDSEIRKYIENCKHSIIKQGENGSAIAMCEKCGRHFGWWCPKSVNGVCEYKDNTKELYYDEWCIHCGDPEERK